MCKYCASEEILKSPNFCLLTSLYFEIFSFLICLANILLQWKTWEKVKVDPCKFYISKQYGLNSTEGIPHFQKLHEISECWVVLNLRPQDVTVSFGTSFPKLSYFVFKLFKSGRQGKENEFWLIKYFIKKHSWRTDATTQKPLSECLLEEGQQRWGQ